MFIPLVLRFSMVGDCYERADGSLSLWLEPSIRCESDEWKRILAVSVLGLSLTGLSMFGVTFYLVRYHEGVMETLPSGLSGRRLRQGDGGTKDEHLQIDQKKKSVQVGVEFSTPEMKDANSHSEAEVEAQAQAEAEEQVAQERERTGDVLEGRLEEWTGFSGSFLDRMHTS